MIYFYLVIILLSYTYVTHATVTVPKNTLLKTINQI